MCLIVLSLTVLICAVLAIALFTLLERKVLGYIQLRKGPNKVAIIGLAQPLADVIKLLTKEQRKPAFSNIVVFFIGPSLGLLLALFIWALIPIKLPCFIAFSTAVIFLCISSINVYSTLLSGWASNSKYALLGRLRAVAQTISYEVSIALILLSALTIMISLEFNSIMSININSWILILPLLVVWLITCLAETNRTPFDLAEGESEIVSGLNVEYSATPLALILIAEYINIILISALCTIIFWPCNNPLILAILCILFNLIFIWVRGTLPRMRYDILISLTWKSFLPIRLIAFIVCIFATLLKDKVSFKS